MRSFPTNADAKSSMWPHFFQLRLGIKAYCRSQYVRIIPERGSWSSGVFWLVWGRQSISWCCRSQNRWMICVEEEVRSKLRMWGRYLSIVGLEIRECPRRRSGDAKISALAWCDERLCGHGRRGGVDPTLHWQMGEFDVVLMVVLSRKLISCVAGVPGCRRRSTILCSGLSIHRYILMNSSKDPNPNHRRSRLLQCLVAWHAVLYINRLGYSRRRIFARNAVFQGSVCETVQWIDSGGSSIEFSNNVRMMTVPAWRHITLVYTSELWGSLWHVVKTALARLSIPIADRRIRIIHPDRSTRRRTGCHLSQCSERTIQQHCRFSQKTLCFTLGLILVHEQRQMCGSSLLLRPSLERLMSKHRRKGRPWRLAESLQMGAKSQQRSRRQLRETIHFVDRSFRGGDIRQT